MNFSSNNRKEEENEKEQRRNKRNRKMRYHESDNESRYLDGPKRKNAPYKRERFDHQYEDEERE